jgi:hypothetical protein
MPSIKELPAFLWSKPTFKTAVKGLALVTVGVVVEFFGLSSLLAGLFA